jgi:hypothetical protein
MTKTIEVTDEQYESITWAAKARGQSPGLLIAEVAEELRDPRRRPRYYETDDWLRHLGVSEERIRRLNVRYAAVDAGRAGADSR